MYLIAPDWFCIKLFDLLLENSYVSIEVVMLVKVRLYYIITDYQGHMLLWELLEWFYMLNKKAYNLIVTK